MQDQMLTVALAVHSAQHRRTLVRELGQAPDVAAAPAAAEARVVFCEVRPGNVEDAQRLLNLASGRPGREVVLVQEKPDPALLIEAMRAGVSEVLTLPLAHEELARMLVRLRERSARKAGQAAAAVEQTDGESGVVIGVVGARPGAGATTLAVHLAAELQRLGPPTALLDMGIPLGECALFLDLEPAYTWGDVGRNLDRLDTTYLGSVMPRHASGLSLLASPGEDGLDPELAPAMPPILAELRRSFIHTVVDTDSVLSPFALRELQGAEEILLALNLTLPGLAHAQRLEDSLRELERGGSRVRLVATRLEAKPAILPAEAEEVLGRKIDWTVPEDAQSVQAALNQGLSLHEAAPRSASAKAISTMARALLRQQPNARGRSGLLSRASASASVKSGSLLGSLFRRGRERTRERELHGGVTS